MRDVFLCDAVRTPIGRYGGSLAKVRTDDLAAVLDALDLRNVTLVGMSMAGGEMVRYLTRHGQHRISRVVFVATDATPIRLQTADNPSGIPTERAEFFRRQLLLKDYPNWMEENRQPFFVPELRGRCRNGCGA